MFEHIKIAFLVLALAAGLSVRPVHASGTVSGTKSYSGTYYATYTSASCQGVGPTPTAAAQNLNTACAPFVKWCSNTDTTWVGGQSGLGYSCTSGTVGGNIGGNAPTITCPANSTANASSSCTCTDPYVATNGVCAIPAPVCPATGTVLSSGFYDVGTVDNGAIPPIVACNNSCSVTYSGQNAQYRVLINGTYHYFALGSYSYDSSVNGGACSSGTASVPSSSGASLPPQSCAPGQGYVSDSNGNLTCLDSSGAPVSPYSPSQQQADQASNAGDASAAGNAAGPAGTAAAAGAGADAATAATAGQQAAANAAGDAAAHDAVCALHPDRLDCMSAGTPPPAGAVSGVTVTASATPVSFSTADGCPAPTSIAIFGKTYTVITYQPACDFFTTLKPIVLTIAAATAAIIMMGVF